MSGAVEVGIRHCYREDVEPAERARLVERHLDIARKAAAMIHPRVTRHIKHSPLERRADRELEGA